MPPRADTNRFEAGSGDLEAIKAIAEEHGFCLVRNVFSAAETEKIKAGMKETHEAFGAPYPDLMSCPALSWVLFDQRILDMARSLLGKELVYYAETNINYEEEIGPITLSPYSKLHCDAMGMPTDLWQSWSSPTDAIYGAYRFGFYFHDYGTSSGALKVGIGSHRGDSAEVGRRCKLTTDTQKIPYGKELLRVYSPRIPLYDVPARAGDVVVWNLRTYHAAGAKRLKLAPETALHPTVEKEMSEAMPDAFYPPPGPRIALFFDYGSPVEESDLYIKNRTYVRAVREENFCAHSNFDSPANIERAARHGVMLRFDYLIAALALALRNGTAGDVNAAATRLMNILTGYRQFSPHFPLFDLSRFWVEMRSDKALAVRNVVHAFAATCDRISSSAESKG